MFVLESVWGKGAAHRTKPNENGNSESEKGIKQNKINWTGFGWVDAVVILPVESAPVRRRCLPSDSGVSVQELAFLRWPTFSLIAHNFAPF